MANCATCGVDILFGGVKADGLRFCGARCHDTFTKHVASVRQAEKYYRSQLGELRQRPTDPDLKTKTLEAGRLYAAATRQGKNVTIFDEVALSNDIQAACASDLLAFFGPLQSWEM